MWKIARCVTSMIVLLALLVLFAAPVMSAVAPPVAKAQNSCCEGCGGTEVPSNTEAPCSSADCPLLLCLVAELVAPVVFQTTLPCSDHSFIFLSHPLPDPFIPAIFHPPKFA
jgi:hypothetical protein